jgi:RNA polymerase sigma-70 factor (ECF subfamily)
MPAAVLALLLLTEARRPARVDELGDVITLDQQDRGRWDAAAIGRGIELLNDSLRRSQGQADAYQLQAAIAAEHARAVSYDSTDWNEILRLYDLLLSVAPSDAAALGRVVATAEAADPATGLALLAELPPNPRWHAVRAELLAREGRYSEAARALTEALDGPATEPERHHRERRREKFLELAISRQTAGSGRSPSSR